MWQAVVVTPLHGAPAWVEPVYYVGGKRVRAAVLLQKKVAQLLEEGVKAGAGVLVLYDHRIGLFQRGAILQRGQRHHVAVARQGVVQIFAILGMPGCGVVKHGQQPPLESQVFLLYQRSGSE